MRKWQPQEIEQIAMHYMKLNSKPGDAVEQLYNLYLSADEIIRKMENDSDKKRISNSDWSL